VDNADERAVDLELDGAPSEEQTRSRVLYDSRLRVPYFLGENDFKETTCDRVVDLQIVGIELPTRAERAGPGDNKQRKIRHRNVCVYYCRT